LTLSSFVKGVVYFVTPRGMQLYKSFVALGTPFLLGIDHQSFFWAYYIYDDCNLEESTGIGMGEVGGSYIYAVSGSIFIPHPSSATKHGIRHK
jgi:hypothetical protein